MASRCRVDTLELLRLSSVNGKGMFLNCWCGDFECIMKKPKGFTVVHEGQLTMWKIDVLRGRHIYIFDRAALRREILRGVGALIRARNSEPEKIIIPNHICLEQKLADARSHAIVDKDEPLTLAFAGVTRYQPILIPGSLDSHPLMTGRAIRSGHFRHPCQSPGA